MSPRTLFLLGGDIRVFDRIADPFLAAGPGPEATIAVLLTGGEGWERHRPSYTDPWARRGVARLRFVVPGPSGRLDTVAALAELEAATGIVVGGGDTAAYQRLYAAEPLRTAIRRHYTRGVPYAGLSAGALLAPTLCAGRSRAPGEAGLWVRPGLGLVEDLAIGVHFTEGGREADLVQVMKQTGLPAALGIGEGACVVLEDGRLVRVVGQPAYRVSIGPRGVERVCLSAGGETA